MPRPTDMENVGSTIRVLIADDHAIVRAGIKNLIDSEPDMHVVAEASSGAEVAALAASSSPDIAVLDLQMPNVGGIEAIKQLSEVAPEVRAIALTMYDDPAYVRLVLAAGGAGFVPKRAVHSEILDAIRTVHAGRTYIEVSIGEGSGEFSPADLAVQSVNADLSKREIEVLSLSARGYTANEIGEKLHLSRKTIEGYRARIKEKLGLHSRAELVRYALEVGLLRPPSTG